MLGLLSLAVSTSIFVASCSSAREAIGFGSEPLSFGPIVDFASLGNETTAAWTQRPFDDILCVGLNTNSWAWSNTGGASWNTCNANSSSCNGSFGTYVAPDAGALAGFTVLNGDPTVVADKQGSVVQVLMVKPNPSGCSDGTEGVLAVVSHDGGQTFDWSTATLVNDNGCSNGCQDQPDATFDYSTNPPTLWIAFRHRANPGHYGACARPYFINGSGNLQAIDMANAVDTASGSVSGHGIGAIRVRAGGGVTTVVYSTTGGPAGCPFQGLESQGAASVSSADGVIWTNNNTIVNSTSYSSCVLSGQIDMGRSSRNYDFVRAIDGTNYVVFQDTQSTLRLYMDRAFGAQPSGRAESEWREWCPGTNTGDAGSPTTNWAPPGIACATPFYQQGQDSDAEGAGNSLAWPTMAADDQGRLAVYFYEADATDTKVHIHFRGNISPRSPTSTWVDANLTADFSPGVGGGSRTLGDYEAMTVRGAFGQPSCGTAGTYYPVWTFADGPPDASNTSSIETLDGGLSFP